MFISKLFKQTVQNIPENRESLFLNTIVHFKSIAMQKTKKKKEIKKEKKKERIKKKNKQNN